MEQTRVIWLGRIIIATSFLILGLALGAFLFSGTQKRALISIPNCSTNCLTASEVKGLLLSIGVQHMPSLLPPIIKETDTVFVIQSPEPQAKIDYLIMPKRDIKDLSQLTPDDRKAIDDTFMVIAELIQEKHLTNYQVVANGPGRQRLNYLHFHLLSDGE